ncbi:hypothetical protein ANCCAN_18585 [Ancylostoma caninum]|uniref:Uncharacterized protein n=1 Tax=Ancylostoma caninum TaxID=29170 RepID=A0A368FTM9_ANCCA|nr:hypothetical protein ANCCAN_18585 [Ancylostoma caninum]
MCKELCKDEPSTVVTLGVGLDVLAELKLKKMLPKGSKFYGADPIYDGNDELYARVGKFFPLAVGNETTYDEASIWTIKNSEEKITDYLVYDYLQEDIAAFQWFILILCHS